MSLPVDGIGISLQGRKTDGKCWLHGCQSVVSDKCKDILGLLQMPQQKAFFLLLENKATICQKKAMFSNEENYVLRQEKQCFLSEETMFFHPLIIPKKKKEERKGQTVPTNIRYFCSKTHLKQERSKNMKKSIYTAFLACTLASAAPIQAQQTDKEAQKARTEQTVKEALEARRYRIEVNYMTPMRGRSRALTDNYSLTIHGDSVLSYLPYVGEAYSAPYGGGKGLNFDALIQTYEAKEGKQGRKEIRFTTTNDEDSYTYHLTIYPDGTTQIRIQPTRRQSISFNGKMDTDE